MGLFDYVRCSMRLPEECSAAQWLTFQTKDAPAYQMVNYMITAEGQLHQMGRAWWDWATVVEVVQMPDGPFRFYTGGDSEDWWEFEASFVGARAQSIRLIKEVADDADV